MLTKQNKQKISQTRPQQKLTVILCVSTVSVFADEQDRLFDTGSFPPGLYNIWTNVFDISNIKKILILLSLLGLIKISFLANIKF